MTEEQVLKFPTIDYGSRDETRTCAICIEDFSDGDNLVQLPCSHQFHTDCIVPWLTERRPVCPLCKHDVRPEDFLHDSRTNTVRRWWAASLALLIGPQGRILVASTHEEPAETNVRGDGER